MIFNLNPEVEKRAAISDVNPNSLLIDDLYFSKTQEEISEFSARITRGLSHQLDDPEDQNYRNYLKIRLSTGLSIAFRRLMGFPVNYSTINEQLNG